MDDEKLNFHYIILYAFRKGVSVRSETKKVYLNFAPALQIVKKWFDNFVRVILA